MRNHKICVTKMTIFLSEKRRKTNKGRKKIGIHFKAEKPIGD